MLSAGNSASSLRTSIGDPSMPINSAAKTPSVPATMAPRTSRAFFIHLSSRRWWNPPRRPARLLEAASRSRRWRRPNPAGRPARLAPLAGSSPLLQPTGGCTGQDGDPGSSTTGARLWSGQAGGVGTPPPNSAAASHPPQTATRPSESGKWADRLTSSRLSALLRGASRAGLTLSRPHVCGQAFQGGGEHPGHVPLGDPEALCHLALRKILVEQVVDNLTLQVGQPFHRLQQDDPVLDRQLEGDVALVRDDVPPDLLALDEVAHRMHPGPVVRAEDLEHAVLGQVHPSGDFRKRRGPAERLAELGDRVGQFPVELPHPPGRPNLLDAVAEVMSDLPRDVMVGIRLELDAPRGIVRSHRVHEADRADLGEIIERNADPNVSPGDLLGQRQVVAAEVLA